MRAVVLLGVLLGVASPSSGETHQVRIPLRQGQLDVGQFTSAVCGELHVPAWRVGGEIDLNTPRGADFLTSVNSCMGEGCRLMVEDGAAVLRVDSDKLPRGCDAVKRAVRVFTAAMNPQSTAAQARHWGLELPYPIDASRALVVLLHGLDADRSDCQPIGELLRQAGHQIAYFGYPGDQSISDSAALLARDLRALHQNYPAMPLIVIAHSMGGLVARQYVEGPDYAGGINRLIMVAPPNHGSKWARARFLLSVQENYNLYHREPGWHWTWVITEGLGEAGSDLMPGSPFLRQLNARPRRAGVRYTIIAGNKSGVDRVEADWVETCSHVIPARARDWWGFRQCYQKLQQSAEQLRLETGNTDGPVSLKSARLSGVSDFVVLPADHASLYLPLNGQPPAAWTVIRQRLRN